VRIAATPERGKDGPALADEILAAVTKLTDGAAQVERTDLAA
jgi:hypothetical protein